MTASLSFSIPGNLGRPPQSPTLSAPPTGSAFAGPTLFPPSAPNRARSGIPWGVTAPDPAPTAKSAGTRPAESKRSFAVGAAAPGVPQAALASHRAAPLPAKPKADGNIPLAYRCDHCGTVRPWPSKPGPEGGLGFCDCGADPLAWYPVRPKAADLAPARLASVRYELTDGNGGSIVGACPVSELLEDLKRVYGDRLERIEPRGPDFNDGLAAPRHG